MRHLPRIAEYVVLGLLVVMQFMDLRIGLDGRPATVSLYLLVFGALSVGLLPLVASGWRMISRRGRLVLACALTLFGWAVASAATSPLPRMFQPSVTVARAQVVVPQVTALVTLLAAWGLAVATRTRPGILRRAALVITLSAVPAAVRTMLARDSVRVATGMGGASTVHVVLLLCLGILLASAMERRRSTIDWAGAAIAVVGILLTSSRAGLAGLLAFALLVGLGLAARGRGRLAAWVLGTLMLALGVMMATLPWARRLFTVGDYGRQINLETAWRAWSSSARTMICGVGSGRMWPWYPFETGHAEIPWKGLIRTGFGRGLTNPHSLPLGVLVELGAVAAVLLAVVLLLPAWELVRRWRRDGVTTKLLPWAAVVTTLPALALDYYLFKNFAISFWWWFVVASLWLAPRQLPPTATATPGGSAASTR